MPIAIIVLAKGSLKIQVVVLNLLNWCYHDSTAVHFVWRFVRKLLQTLVLGSGSSFLFLDLVANTPRRFFGNLLPTLVLSMALHMIEVAEVVSFF